MAKSVYKVKDIRLADSRLVTTVNGNFIGTNFRELKNLRYNEIGLEGVGGMTKINSTPDGTYFKPRSSFQFLQGSTSYVVSQFWNTGLTASKLFTSTAAVPATGEFSAAYTENTNADVGRFSNTPSELLAYCNGQENLVYGGTTSEISSFLLFNDKGFFDFTEKLNNSQNDSDNLVAFTDNGNDSACKLLLKFENNVTDSSTGGGQTVTNGGMTFDSSNQKFGNYCGSFDGTNDYLSVPDFIDMTNDFCLDFWFRVDSSMGEWTEGDIFYHATDASNSFRIYIDKLINASILKIEWLKTALGTYGFSSVFLTDDTWYHFELSYEADTELFYFFINGEIQYIYDIAGRNQNYTGTVYIGCEDAGTTNPFYGLLDEFRFRTEVGHREPFVVPSLAYETGALQQSFYIGSLTPIDGFTVTVETANIATSSLSVEEWTGSSWSAVSNLSDGTVNGGVSLAQTGTVSFDGTSSSSKVKELNQVFIYWYRIDVSMVDDATEISQIQLSVPFQNLQDIWDGNLRTTLSCVYNDAGVLTDYTLNIYEEDYVSGTASTYLDLSSYATEDYIYLGYAEKLQAIYFGIITGTGYADRNLTIEYWNGKSWQSCSNLVDGTTSGKETITMYKSGYASWYNSTDDEVKRSIIRNGFQLFYYRVSLSGDPGTAVYVDYIGGVPKAEKIEKYSFPFHAQDRLILCSQNTKDKNTVLFGASGSAVVMNGSDSLSLSFGNSQALTGAVNLYSQFGSSLYDLMCFLKTNETWIVAGTSVDSWVKYKVSSEIGVVAPLTIQTLHVDFEVVPGLNRNIAIWQASDGIYLFDGRTFYPIHKDIADLFDKRNTNGLTVGMESKSVGFIDPQWQEYHWLCATGQEQTTLNREFVYNFMKQKWFEIDRTTGKYLQVGIRVQSSTGKTYTYGFLETGYCERLENGNTFDGTAIEQSFRIGELELENSVYAEQQLRGVKLLQVAKTSTSNSVSLSYFGNGKSTAQLTKTFSPAKTGYEFADVKKSFGTGFYSLHSLKFSLSTSDEVFGFEPVLVSILFQPKSLEF